MCERHAATENEIFNPHMVTNPVVDVDTRKSAELETGKLIWRYAKYGLREDFKYKIEYIIRILNFKTISK